MFALVYTRKSRCIDTGSRKYFIIIRCSEMLRNVPCSRCYRCPILVVSQKIYLLLSEFEGRTVSYGPSFFSSIYGPSAKRAGHESKWKKRGSVTYSTDRENEVSKIFIRSLLCVWGAQERFLLTRNDFKFLTHLESKTIHFEIAFKSLARSSTQFRVKESFKFLLAMKVKNSWR